MIQTNNRREERHVLGWRYEELVRAGYSERQAMVLSDRVDIDLHRAVGLLRSGCAPRTAIRILL